MRLTRALRARLDFRPGPAMFLTMKMLSNVRGAGPKRGMWSLPSFCERVAILLSLAFSLCFFAVCRRNHPPTTPDITGFLSSRPGDTAELSATSTDQDDDLVSYLFAWGDTSGAVWSPDYPSGVTVTRGHLYAESGAYAVRSRARDDKGAESDWSAIETLRVGIFPPGIPARPVGPAVGLTGVAYRCSTCATSPYGEPLYIQFAWSGGLGLWSGPVASDSPYVETHWFDSSGLCAVRARSKDTAGTMSAWSDSLVISVTIFQPARPTVMSTSIDTGAALRLSWAAVAGAEFYEITTEHSTDTTTALSWDITTPTGTVQVFAIKDSVKSDPATIDCKVVETSGLVLYGKSDPDPNHPSGLAFASAGSASMLSLDDANKASIDYVCDDESISPVGLVNAGDYGWPQNDKLNRLMDAGTTDYDAFDEAAASGYDSQHVLATNGVYVFWLSSSTTWTTDDHFCKARIYSIENVGGFQKVTLRVGYQRIGGLRWLRN